MDQSLQFSSVLWDLLDGVALGGQPLIRPAAGLGVGDRRDVVREFQGSFRWGDRAEDLRQPAFGRPIHLVVQRQAQNEGRRDRRQAERRKAAPGPGVGVELLRHRLHGPRAQLGRSAAGRDFA